MDSRIAELRSIVEGQSRSLTVPLEYRAPDPARDGEAFKLTGHAAVFDRRSEDLGGFREIIKRGAFRKALDDNQDVVALWDHDTRYVLARTTSDTLKLHEDPRGLNVWASVADTSYARDLSVLLERRDISQMSFGFIVGEDRWNIRKRDDGTEEVVREVLSVDRLFDVSVVAVPAYPQTDAAARELSMEEIVERAVERALRNSPTIPGLTPVGVNTSSNAGTTSYTFTTTSTTSPTQPGLDGEELRSDAVAEPTEELEGEGSTTQPTVDDGDVVALRRARLRLRERADR